MKHRYDRIRLRLHPFEQGQAPLHRSHDKARRTNLATQAEAAPQFIHLKYNIDQLVDHERFATITAAIAREKELKGWIRYRKIALIVSSNPDWRDLSTDWGKPTKPFREEDLRPPRKLSF